MNQEEIIKKLIELSVEYGPRVIGAVILLIIGFRVISFTTKFIKKVMESRDINPSLRPFIASLLGAIFKVLLFLSCAELVGVATTSFVAILASAGLAVGMALSGTLQNFAGGVMILILKPFKVGDFIIAQGFSGIVKEIQIFSTHLNTGDNRRIIIPNGPLSTGALENVSFEDTRRVDLDFGIDYSDDFKKAKILLEEIISSHDKILKEPQAFVRVSSLGDSAVNISTKSWVNKEDYWEVHFDLIETVKTRFDQEGISFPFPQTDVHLYKNK